MAKTIIHSEEDAFHWLEKYLDNKLAPLEFGELELQGWPCLTIRLSGSRFDQSLTPGVMKGFIELQGAINRSVALSKTGVPNANQLSKSERDALEIEVKVEKGSSILEVNFQGLLNNVATNAVANMDPTTIAATVIGTAMIWGSTVSFKAFLQSRRDVRMEEVKTEKDRQLLETMQFMTEQETKRAETLANLLQRSSSLDNMARFADDAKVELLKSAARADIADIDGVSIDSETAKELYRNARRKSEEVRLDGEYRILRNDTTDPNAFKVRVRNKQTGKEFEALVQDDSLTATIKTALQKAEWDRTFVKLRINAKSLDETINAATVIGLDS